MPRPKSPPRLQRRADRPTDAERAAGIVRYNWVIRDGDKYVRTGCAEADRSEAERKLAEYLGEKHDPVHRNSASAELEIADILNVYGREKGPDTARPAETASALLRLDAFWGKMKASDILGPTCRAYTEHRGRPAAARRDLEVLRAAVKHYKREYGMEAEPVFTLPPKSIPRERWLTRDEVAKLVWVCYRSKGNDKRLHLVRFILIAVYTGTRHDAILRLQWMPNTTGGWADLQSARLYRRPALTRETKKRTPTIRIPDRLLAHMRRWKKQDQGILNVIHYQGRAIGRLEKSFRSAREDAGLGEDVIPHALRHTAITWLMQAGVNINEVSGFTGVTTEELQRTYWHHSPDFHSSIATARMSRKPRI
ncbi:site-specific integrase [Aureimonas sp. AU20]|uniref:site-specific integrase n=1 Tax=Aureimonas sp. AU20 TaxID=1349819 RepID=UPI0007220CE4|nr:site-specific integrase [Aureimonas sp. AU20]ALN73572.1 hypothetical protein M673_12660 [Aureimonas sp. AU20]